ncbi:MAG: tyrosinase family protein [Alphaproteobacteria bacterium]|nr:tyrosinase family protein [Alphaproteobacteria bacterium]MBL6939693.1 tyrosinase family protein [Alphaproteobacteria bacterium]MBL7096985.1 tyrosinase family protein [Alphaproteobacteria bacterium]
MQHTRRRFIGTATALSALTLSGAAASPGTRAWPLCDAPPGPVRLSLPAFAADPKKVASLRKGIGAMKALKPSDHRSYFFQAAVHAYSDTQFKVELSGDPGLKKVDKKYWNQCPHFGQSSADFVIWHRAYLHFFERTLRVMAQDDTLALPYWDYTRPEQRTFPEIYAPEFLDNDKKVKNPLFHPNREKAFVKGLLEVSDLVGKAEKTMASATFFHQTGAPGLGGDDLDEDHTQVGLLEQRPHNDIHLAVGGVINSANGAMAEITTAAFDPVFWAHHANIDRMWQEWANAPGKSWGTGPGSEWFDDRRWLFLNADGTEVRLSRREAVMMLAAYDVDYPNQLTVPGGEVSPPPPPPPAASTPAPGAGAGRDMAMPPMVGAAAPPVATTSAPPPKRAAPPRRPTERELIADNTPMIVTPHNSGRRLFGDPPPGLAHSNGIQQSTGGAPAKPVLKAPELADPNAKVLLELADISFTLVPSSGFAVYLDSAGKPASEPVGLIDIFGLTHKAGMNGMRMKSAQRFDVTGIVRKGTGPYTVRIEAYDLLVMKDGTAPRSRADGVQIGAVRFVVIS